MPEIGRFISADPVPSVNLYVYVENGPIGAIDPSGKSLCAITLPGLGATYLDSVFSSRVRLWITYNQSDQIDVFFTQGFRTTQHQQSLQDNPSAITPATAGNSLHECGFAVDISWRRLTCEQEKDTVVENAGRANIHWGGHFSTYDPVHFYFDPGNRATLIPLAQQQYSSGVTQICQ